MTIDHFKPGLGEPHHLEEARLRGELAQPARLAPAAQLAELRSSLEERGLRQYLGARLGEVDSTFHDASATLGA